MPTLVLTALFILAEPFVLASASPVRVSSGAVEWKGKDRSMEDLKQETSPAAVSAVYFWKAWTDRSDYRLILSEDAEILVIWPQERRSAKKVLDLLRDTTQRMNKLIPQQTSNASANASGDVPPGFSPEDIFEDWKTEEDSAGSRSWSWGERGNPPDTDTIVLGHFRNPEQYADALLTLARSFEYLRPWAEKGSKLAGCVLERPLFGAVVENVAGMEEWSVEHEWVHRVAQLRMLRRSGQQPVWLSLGLAWNVELELKKSIYCFPWRSGFVAVSEHTGWDRRLEKLIRDRDKPLRMFDVAACHRDEFDEECALLSWGLVRFLIQHYPEKLTPLLQEFGGLRHSLGREYESYSSWTLDGDYAIPTKDQDEALRRIVCPDALDQFARWGQLGRRWKKPK